VLRALQLQRQQVRALQLEVDEQDQRTALRGRDQCAWGAPPLLAQGCRGASACPL